MPPGKRHFSRGSLHPTRVPSININASLAEESQKLRKVCATCINEGLCDIVPIHIPVPVSKSNDYILTDVFAGVFSLACGFVQYFNIYQSAWWLPHSYHYYGFNYHLVDWFVVQFIAVMALRPLVFSVLRKYFMKLVKKYDNNKNLGPCLRMVVGFLIIGYGIYCGIYFWWIYGFIMLLIMYLPWTLYSYMYNRNIRDFFDFSITSFPSGGFIKGMLMHRCAPSSQRSRDEVEFLRADFNARMKCLLFNSFSNAYYCVYIPACYSQGFLYFEDNWVSYYIILVWFTCICIYLTRYFPFNYYDACHRAALHLGRWSKVNGKFAPYYAWIDSIFWYKGIVVKHNGITYKAESVTNSAEPGNKVHEYFYCCFAKPGSLIYWWLGLEISVVCLQFVFLLFSTQWNHVLASCMMLMCTYYALYKCIKNYNLCDTLYKLEDAVQTRMIAS